MLKPIPYTEREKQIAKQARSDAIDGCKQILKTKHMIRTCEDDYIAGIEAPFYKNLWNRFNELKEKK